jgi:hypothetical protein
VDLAHQLGLDGHLSEDRVNELQIFELPKENRGSNWISFYSEGIFDGSSLSNLFWIY